MEYFEKHNENPYGDLAWNIPERKQGVVAVVGGNAQSFRAPIKIAEWLEANYPVEAVRMILPDALEPKLPPLPNIVFVKSTESGSVAETADLLAAIEDADYGLIVGDLSRNAVTAKAVTEACGRSATPLLMTRDAVDLLVSEARESILMNENLILFASMAQLQKLLRALYYPKMLTMTQPLTQVAEILHKFTLSYPIKIITLHNGQILVAQNGDVAATPLESSGRSPITIWDGELAAKIAAFNLYNPANFLRATICALFN